MSGDDRMHVSTVHLCSTNKKGEPTYTEHQVWDRALFVETRRADAIKTGGVVALITREQYLDERGDLNRRAS